MRVLLAEQLLARIMDWSPEEVFIERPLLQALADFKYNEYQQFSAGIRFIESLVRWLEQFQTEEEKKIAYEFVKNKLLFISAEQLSVLVNIAFSSAINPILIKKTADELCLPEYYVCKIINSPEYKKSKRCSLFIGLTDGSRIDQLRRCIGLSNEQVHTTYQISETKKKDLIAELQKDYEESKFSIIFLIDDFTGSGKSYFRNDDQIETGKILKFLIEIFEKNMYDDLFDKAKLELHIIFYIATEDSISTLENKIEKWRIDKNLPFKFSIHAIQLLDKSIKEDIIQNKPLMELLKNYFDESIVDSHFKKGNHNKPFLGFDECSLPLILNHNTPNNSLPILWLPEDKKFKGLFPRLARHRDE